MNDALVGRNCIKKEFLCLKGVLVLYPVRCNDPDVQRGVGVLVWGFGHFVKSELSEEERFDGED